MQVLTSLLALTKNLVCGDSEHEAAMGVPAVHAEVCDPSSR
jgi:hypothetical protein